MISDGQSQYLLLEEAKNTAIDVAEVGGLLRAARGATGANAEQAAEWAGVYKKTILNWEAGASPHALRLVIYMRRLVKESPLAERFILLALGIGETW